MQSIIHSYKVYYINFKYDSENEFPSPYGVSFILILDMSWDIYLEDCKVSVSLRSIIHSYLWIEDNNLHIKAKKGFRLLTEYHSFLYEDNMKTINIKGKKFPSPYGVSFILMSSFQDCISPKKVARFRLLTEYHSFLL